MKSYSSYKDSGVKWIGEIPSHWDVCKMKHCGGLICGGTPSTNRDDYWGGDIPWIQSGKVHFKKITIDDVDKFITELGFRESSTKMVRKDSPVIAITGATCSNVGFLTFDSTVNQSIIGIQVNEVNTSYYIYYYMISQKNQILYHQSGGAQGGVTKGDVENLNIPKISYSEQTQIVSFLDSKTQKIDELIEKTEQKIKLLKEKRTSLINHCVTKGLNPNVEMKDSGVEWIGEIPKGWKVLNGSYIGLYSKGKGIKKDEVVEVGNPCVRYGEIYTKYELKIDSTFSFISDETTTNSVSVKTGTLLLTGSGETKEEIGKCIVYLGNEILWVGGDIIVLKPSEQIDSLFLSYLINSECIRVQREMSGKGEIVVHIYSKNFKEMKYPIPPFSEQTQIVEYLDKQTQKIDSTIEKETQRIELLKEYRQSLISEVVTGKIDVMEWNG